MNAPHPSQLPWQVSELLAALHQRIDAEFGAVRIEGEVSSLSNARSGHRYFSLKDADGQIRCAWFRSSIRGQALSDGQKIIAHGRIAIYSARGDLQLIVSAIEDVGDGHLAAAFERLKKKLAAEGLFNAQSKLPLSPPVRQLIIVSSPQAAALQDILVTLRRRDPFLALRLVEVPVQGTDAPPKIAAALRDIGDDDPAEAVLLARGGGSLEDLQAFNSEAVARAIAACARPVVSAVGHETDFTISDMVATVRAATPTAGAELLSTNRSQDLQRIFVGRQKLALHFRRRLDGAQQYLRNLSARLLRQSPSRRLENQLQTLDRAQLRLDRAIRTRMIQGQECYLQLHQRLQRSSPALTVQQNQTLVSQFSRKLHLGFARYLERKQARLKQGQSRLQALGPRQVLERGYALVHANQSLISRAAELPSPLREVRICWQDGERILTVSEAGD